MSNLTILNSSIRTLDNLYCLNDFHKIGGNESRHQPSFFFRSETTKELLNEIDGTHDLQKCRSVKIIRGRNIQGTYACEELALAYAMWISPKFHLVVLRAFIAMHRGEAEKSVAIAPLTITPEQQQQIQSAVQQAHHRTGLHWQEIYRQLKVQFSVAKYDQLPQTDFQRAMNFIQHLKGTTNTEYLKLNFMDVIGFLIYLKKVNKHFARLARTGRYLNSNGITEVDKLVQDFTYELLGEDHRYFLGLINDYAKSCMPYHRSLLKGALAIE